MFSQHRNPQTTQILQRQISQRQISQRLFNHAQPNDSWQQRSHNPRKPVSSADAFQAGAGWLLKMVLNLR